MKVLICSGGCNSLEQIENIDQEGT